MIKILCGILIVLIATPLCFVSVLALYILATPFAVVAYIGQGSAVIYDGFGPVMRTIWHRFWRPVFEFAERLVDTKRR